MHCPVCEAAGTARHVLEHCMRSSCQLQNLDQKMLQRVESGLFPQRFCPAHTAICTIRLATPVAICCPPHVQIDCRASVGATSQWLHVNLSLEARDRALAAFITAHLWLVIHLPQCFAMHVSVSWHSCDGLMFIISNITEVAVFSQFPHRTSSWHCHSSQVKLRTCYEQKCM